MGDFHVPEAPTDPWSWKNKKGANADLVSARAMSQVFRDETGIGPPTSRPVPIGLFAHDDRIVLANYSTKVEGRTRVMMDLVESVSDNPAARLIGHEIMQRILAAQQRNGNTTAVAAG